MGWSGSEKRDDASVSGGDGLCHQKGTSDGRLESRRVLPDETVKEAVEYLLKQLHRLELEAGCLYLDRGFGVIEIARCLKEIKQRAIIACPSARKDRRVESAFVWGSKVIAPSTFSRVRNTARKKSRMAMFKGFTTTAKKVKRYGKRAWSAYMLIECDEKLSAKTVKKRYRKRFAIEASYRSRQKSARLSRRVPMPPIGLS